MDGTNDNLYFFDTYAFFELIAGNLKYKKFELVKPITTIFNLAELNFALKREGKEFADRITRELETFLVDVTADDIIEAMSFRLKHKKLSIPDAVGYIIAGKNNARFLTGDKEFENLPNVEFIK